MRSLSRRDGFFYALALWVFSYSSHILQALSVIQRSHTAPLSQGRFPTSSQPQKFSFKNWSYRLLSKVISHILQCYVVQVVPDDTMIPLYHLSVNPFLQSFLKKIMYFFTLKRPGFAGSQTAYLITFLALCFLCLFCCFYFVLFIEISQKHSNDIIVTTSIEYSRRDAYHTLVYVFC